MKTFRQILYQLVMNSNAFFIVILSTVVALYQAWQNLDTIKNNIISTIFYSIIFILAMLEFIHIHNFFICCLKKKIKIYKMISALKDIDQTFSDVLNGSEEENLECLQKIGDYLSSIIQKFDVIKKKTEKKDTQNSTNIQINNDIN